MSFTVTHYTRGKGVPRYLLTEEHLSAQELLVDIFCRLQAGANVTTSGYNYGLVTYVGPDEEPTGSDSAIYGRLGPKLQDFLIRATKWWQQEAMKLQTPEHNEFIRRLLLEATGHNLSNVEMTAALQMQEDQFLAAMAMAIETGEDVTLLFHPTTTH